MFMAFSRKASRAPGRANNAPFWESNASLETTVLAKDSWRRAASATESCASAGQVEQREDEAEEPTSPPPPPPPREDQKETFSFLPRADVVVHPVWNGVPDGRIIGSWTVPSSAVVVVCGATVSVASRSEWLCVDKVVVVSAESGNVTCLTRLTASRYAHVAIATSLIVGRSCSPKTFSLFRWSIYSFLTIYCVVLIH